MSIAIVIDERAARAPANCVLQQARLPGHVSECAVSVIAIEDVLAPVSDEDIFEAVVVVIADRHAARPSRCASALPFRSRR